MVEETGVDSPWVAYNARLDGVSIYVGEGEIGVWGRGWKVGRWWWWWW